VRVAYTGRETIHGEIVRSARTEGHARTPLQLAIGRLVNVLLVAAVMMCLVLAMVRLQRCVTYLRGVDLEIRAGELIVLPGPFGSGNGTLLNILGGLDFASDGTALFQDHDLTQADECALTPYRRPHVGFRLPAVFVNLPVNF
jgi:predicted ABC-type transport system involved in lysophospholipase L1 biosynthesis ATPase subunit